MNDIIKFYNNLLADDKMKLVQPSDLEEMVYEACKAAFGELISAHPDERFYAFGLWTDDSLQFLNPAANTEERLDRTVQDYKKNVDPEYGTTSTHEGMRWSYGDWGFFPADTGENQFAAINKELSRIFQLEVSDDEFESLVNPLWDAIVGGFYRLDKEEFWRDKFSRSNITLLLVGDLPEELVDACAKALNPPEIADKYVNWNVEP